MRSAASETPPPMPHTSTVSPARTAARVTIIRRDDPGAVGAEDVREPAVTRQAAHDEEIEMIQRGGPEGDPNVARSEGGIRLGNVSYLYLIEAAGGADDAGEQGSLGHESRRHHLLGPRGWQRHRGATGPDRLDVDPIERLAAPLHGYDEPEQGTGGR